MTSVDLTPERRARLAALLADDGALLRAEYPEVADYLATAERLPGTGNPETDAAFDLALLNHMTGSDSPNPYWDIVATATTVVDGRRVINGGNPDGSPRLRLAQTFLQAAYAYAVPSPETIEWIVATTEGRPIVEIGAGRGYWAHQLTLAGLDVCAYDTTPPGPDDRNPNFRPIHGLPHQWHPVGNLRDLATATQALRLHDQAADHVLLLCWPPAWKNPMAHNALRAYERQGGTHLIYIGEPRNGMSATTPFFNTLESHWHPTTNDPTHPTWWNLTDTAQSWTRG